MVFYYFFVSLLNKNDALEIKSLVNCADKSYIYIYMIRFWHEKNSSETIFGRN